MKSTFRTYTKTLLGIMSWKVALVLGLMACLSLTEGVGLLLLIPMLQLVGFDVEQGAISRLAEFVSTIFTTIGLHPTLIAVLAAYVLIIATHALLNRWRTAASLTLQHEFVVSLRRRLYQAIANANWIFFARSRSSDFTHALTTELDRVGIATEYLLLLTVNAIVVSVYILLALQLSAVMTGLVFAFGAGLLLLLKGKSRAAHATGEELSQATNDLYAATIEHLDGMKTARSYGAQDRHVEIFSRLTERVAHVYTDATRNHAGAKLWFDIGSVLILSILLYVSFEILAIPAAGVLLMLFLFARIIPKFSSIQQSYQYFMNVLPAFDLVMAMQARCEAAAEPKAEPSKEIKLRHVVQLEQVSFSYEEDGTARVINSLDLTINAGDTTAIVGPSGAGKSTIADLVLGLVVPDHGRLLVDGIPLRSEHMRSWREQIGYVAQDTFLFHETVRANLLWARPEATDDAIREALKLAAADEFVSRLPQGVETVIGDRGVRLSGGERQRLALARALLRKPVLLILDEATSALDSENERRIQNAIEQLHGQVTVLVITHRLSTVRWADVIHVLEQGRLVESGTWDEMIARGNGRFNALCKAQGIDLADEVINRLVGVEPASRV